MNFLGDLMTLDQDDYFDDCSTYTTVEDDMVADDQLSPLQLPQAQLDYRQLDRIHWDEISFVFPDYNHQPGKTRNSRCMKFSYLYFI
jgi:hypothetical protein